VSLKERAQQRIVKKGIPLDFLILVKNFKNTMKAFELMMEAVAFLMPKVHWPKGKQI